MPPIARRLALALVLLSVVEIAAELVGAAEVMFVTKATLLPLIGAIYLASVPSPRTRTDRRMVVAFAGSWVGDVSLMLAPAHPTDHAVLGIPKHDLWFVVGVAAFLICHLALIGVYRDVSRPDVPGPFPRRWAWFAPIAVYGVAMASFLVPRVLADPQRALAAGPVAVYAGVLCTMVAFALQRHGRVTTPSFVRVLVGAVIFLASDSLIAIVHLARVDLPQHGFLIMSTYLVAEILIAWGVATQRRDDAGVAGAR